VEIYLPIADLPVNVFVVFAMGLAVGFISGMFGIGGGFLMTPLLIFLGVTPAVSVATVSTHIAASSFSGAIAYWRRRAVDLSLALMLLLGGFVGTAAGVGLFTYLRALGQLDLTISLLYVMLLGSVGTLMVAEAVRAVHGGQSLINPSMAGKLLTEFATLAKRDSEEERAQHVAAPKLTDREMEVLKLVARGMNNRDIAKELYISENTVKNHVRNILEKLQIHSRMEAVMIAVREKLIEFS